MSHTIFQAQPKAGARMLPKESEIKYIAAVNRFFLMTPHQLTRRFHRGNVTNYYPIFKRLADDGYLAVVTLGRFSPEGRAPIAYKLGANGRSLLKSIGHDVPVRLRKVKEGTPLHKPHTLAVNDFLLAAEQIALPQLTLNHFIHEQTLIAARIPVQLPNGRRVLHAPDAFLDFRITEGDRKKRVNIILEEDLDTHHKGSWETKVLAHLAAMQGAYQEYFGIKRFGIAVHTTDADRLEELMQWTERLLLAQHADHTTRNSWLFSAYPAVSANPVQLFVAPVWYRPFRERAMPIVQVALDSEPMEPTDRLSVALRPRVIAKDILAKLERIDMNEAYADRLLQQND